MATTNQQIKDLVEDPSILNTEISLSIGLKALLILNQNSKAKSKVLQKNLKNSNLLQQLL